MTQHTSRKLRPERDVSPSMKRLRRLANVLKLEGSLSYTEESRANGERRVMWSLVGPQRSIPLGSSLMEAKARLKALATASNG